jgi:NADH-quinone oxidoreductase subunit N
MPQLMVHYMDNVISSLVALPEILLAILGFFILIVGLVNRANVARVCTLLTVFAFIVCGVVVAWPWRMQLFFGGGLPVPAFGWMFVDDGFARFVKLLLLTASGLSLLLSGGYLERQKIARPEYPVLVLFATLGMMLMVSASDFLSLYVGLELQSLALYVLAAFRRDDIKSSEAGLKYFVLGALASGIILYGISLLYGFAGTTDFLKLGKVLHTLAPHSVGVVVGMVFIVAAMAFKVSAVPFHMWTPDVYEGAPTPVTALFAAAPKIAALVAFTRILYSPFHNISHQWDQIIVVIAVASMVLGSFAGLAQSNIKRLMAYSSIANVGFALSALTVVGKGGILAMLIYLAIYFVNTLGVFGVLMFMSRKGEPAENMSDMAGLGKTNPLLALAMMMFMFSLAGVPPLAGFFGKYFVFLAVVNAHMVPLAVIGVLTSVVSAFYYLRIIKLMYFDVATEPVDRLPRDYIAEGVLALMALFMIGFTIWPAPLVDAAHRAVSSLLLI